jgi:glycerol-3-phosphate dehydrogenase
VSAADLPAGRAGDGVAAGAAGNALARGALLGRLRETPEWDVVVIGGGATGLGCAVDAAARGHSTLLVEGHDFAKGTSSRATKLIHGGVRYLAQGNLGLVREALAERARLLANAPHLVHRMRFVVPTYRWHEKPLLGIGLTLYDLLAGSHGIGRSRLLDPARTVAALPTVNPVGLRGGVAYWDAQFDDARLAVSLMRTLFDLGGLALNYLPVEGLISEAGRVRGVVATDAERGETFRIAARAVINATGVWVDAVRRLERPAAGALLRPSQGVHVVVDRDFLPGADALLVPHTADGRVLFVIPWHGKVLIGTTDSARADLPLEPEAGAGEIDFILETASRYLVRAPTRADVRSVFVGLRPLIGAGDASATRNLSREHCIEVSPGGLVTITGGKWTTYRRMAEETVDTVESVAGLPRREAATATLRLHGATARPCTDPYGSEREAVDALPGATRRVLDGLDLTEAEVRHAVRNELARTVEDVLARRHRALFIDAAQAVAAAPAVAALIAEELGRDAAWRDAELVRFRALAMQYRTT